MIARGHNAAVIAFAEATLRRDYVNGCTASPVGFLEGLYVDPEFRHRGIARKLCRAVEDWAASLGCSEFASDVHLHNEASQKAHEALGFGGDGASGLLPQIAPELNAETLSA